MRMVEKIAEYNEINQAISDSMLQTLERKKRKNQASPMNNDLLISTIILQRTFTINITLRLAILITNSHTETI